MEASISDDATLYELRTSCGLSHQQVVEGVAAFLKQETKNWSASAQWEVRGVNDADILDALAFVLGCPSEIVRKASKNSRAKGRPLGVKPGRRKSSNN